MYRSMDELHQAIAGVLRLDGTTPTITNEQRLRETSIDQFVLSAVFATDPEVKTQARSTIRQLAEGLLIRSASIHDYYLAFGAGAVPATSTVPAINIRSNKHSGNCLNRKNSRYESILSSNSASSLSG